uniref:Nerve growth factor-related domain-containing protein n=1 Tax=Poecilia latipinna TaxID=48699 RepID=A0A3B3U6V0_9TELE
MVKHHHLHFVHVERGVFSVCESISTWVRNKTTATNIAGNEVTVLEHVNINNMKVKQYFYETKCLENPSGNTKCLGIDARTWSSYCKNVETYVRALTSFESKVTWSLIRINAECVCFKLFFNILSIPNDHFYKTALV